MAHEMSFLIQFGIGLRNRVQVLLVRREVHKFITHPGHNGNIIRKIEGSNPCSELRRHFCPCLDHHFAALGINDVLPQRVTDECFGSGLHSVDHLAIRRLDEAQGIDAGMGCQAADQSDVGPLRCLNRADTPVVAIVHVAHIEAGPFTSQPTRSQCRQSAFMGQFRQRIGLLHKLRELAGAKELANDCNYRADVHQVHRGQRL